MIDPIIDRVLKRSNNAPYDYVGTRKPMGKVDALAALLDCTQDRIDRVRAFGGLVGDLFVDQDHLRAMLDRKAMVRNVVLLPPRGDQDVQQGFLDYCRHQITSAQTKDELEAALALVDMLAHRTRRRDLHDLKNLAKQ